MKTGSLVRAKDSFSQLPAIEQRHSHINFYLFDRLFIPFRAINISCDSSKKCFNSIGERRTTYRKKKYADNENVEWSVRRLSRCSLLCSYDVYSVKTLRPINRHTVEIESAQKTSTKSSIICFGMPSESNERMTKKENWNKEPNAGYDRLLLTSLDFFGCFSLYLTLFVFRLCIRAMCVVCVENNSYPCQC